MNDIAVLGKAIAGTLITNLGTKRVSFVQVSPTFLGTPRPGWLVEAIVDGAWLTKRARDEADLADWVLDLADAAR